MRSESCCKVVVVEDHPLMRAAVERAVQDGGHVVVGLAADAESGRRLVVVMRPSVAVIDVTLGDDSGVELGRRLLQRDPALGVVLYTGWDDPATLADALDSGARGLVLKTSPPDALKEAIRTVHGGGTYVDEGARARIRARKGNGHARVLSGREREVLELMSRGLTAEQVARRLVLSDETVKSHVVNARRKLGAHNRTHAVVLALRTGELRL